MGTPYASFENTRFFGPRGKSGNTGLEGRTQQSKSVSSKAVTVQSTMDENSHSLNLDNKGVELKDITKAAFIGNRATSSRSIVAEKTNNEVQHIVGKNPSQG